MKLEEFDEDIPKGELELQEEVLEYISRGITGDRNIKLEIKDIPTSYVDIEGKTIHIQKNMRESENFEDSKRFWKAFNLHESGHIAWSGSLREEYKSWIKENGEFENFKDCINAIEDARIEHIMTQILPQSRKYFIGFMQKYIEKCGGAVKTNNPIMALRAAVENKIDMPYIIDEEAVPYIDKAVEKFHEYDVLNGDWKNVVNCALEIHTIFRKLGKKFPKFDMYGGMKEDLDKISKELAETDKEYHKIKEELEKIRDEIGKTAEKDSKLGELNAKYEDCNAKISTNTEKHSELLVEKNELSGKIKNKEMKRTSEKEIEGLIRRNPFELRKKAGKYSTKTTKQIMEVMERVVEEFEDSGEFQEFERNPVLPIPEVITFADDVVYSHEGSYEIPEPGLAIEMGTEIASELKRELKLKRALVKRKQSGKIDMRRVRKQFVAYREIREMDIFGRHRKLLPEHSVLIMIDYSGSMTLRTKLVTAKQALATFARTLSQLNVNHSIRGYCALKSKCLIGDVVIKEFDKEEVDYNLINKSFFPYDSDRPGWWGENRDGDSWRYGAELLAQQKGEKLLIVISDGVPYHGGTNYQDYIGEDDSELAVRQIEELGIKTIGISIDRNANHYIEHAFKNSFFFDGAKLKELSEGLTEVYINTMKVK